MKARVVRYVFLRKEDGEYGNGYRERRKKRKRKKERKRERKEKEEKRSSFFLAMLVVAIHQ